MGKTLDGYRRIFEGLKKGEIHNLYFLYGPEEYLKREFVRELIEAVLPESERAFNLDIIHGDEFDRALFDDRVGSFPLFAQRRIVILRNFRALPTAARDHVIEAAENLAPSLVFVIETPEPKPDTARTRKLAKIAGERGLAVPFSFLDERETVQRVRGRLQREGYTITPEALDHLVDSVGTRVIDLGNEVEKILLAAGDTREIDRNLVSRVVGRYRAEDVFALLDDLSRDNPAVIVEKLSKLIDGGEEPVFMLTMLLRRVVQLMEVQAILEERGKAASSSRALAEYMAAGTSPYFAEILRRMAKSVAPAMLDVLLTNLRWADIKIKSTPVPPRTILEEALIAAHLNHRLRMSA